MLFVCCKGNRKSDLRIQFDYKFPVPGRLKQRSLNLKEARLGIYLLVELYTTYTFNKCAIPKYIILKLSEDIDLVAPVTQVLEQNRAILDDSACVDEAAKKMER